MKKEKKTRGRIRGWLLFYAIGIYLSLVFNIFSTLAFFSTETTEDNFLFVICLVISIFTIFYLYLMHTHKKLFKKITIILLYIGIIIGILLIILTLVEINQENSLELMFLCGRFAIGIVIMILWLKYFKKSKDVKNTFTK